MLSFSKLTRYKLTFVSVPITNEFKPFLFESIIHSSSTLLQVSFWTRKNKEYLQINIDPNHASALLFNSIVVIT